jgi:hypothetical protein
VRLQYRRWLDVEDHHFDHATITVNGSPKWHNYDSHMGDASHTQHRDREWRFQDVDLSDAAQSGSVTVKLELESDAGLELGGWTVDDFCIVAFDPPKIPPIQCANDPCDGDVPKGDAAASFEAEGCGCRIAGEARGFGATAWAMAIGIWIARRRRSTR